MGEDSGGYSKNKAISPTPHFENVPPHMWALPMIKHKVKLIMTLNINRSQHEAYHDSKHT
jgi:hypothetical protein